MDTKKMRWVSGNSVIEMSYIMPLFFSLFVIIIHTVFYYHDKAIIEGAAADTHLAGSVAHGGGLAYLQHPFGLCYPEKDLRQSVGGD